MATFTTAAAAAALASWRPAAFIARSPAASPSLWTPLRSPSPAVGLRRADASPRRGSTLLVSPSRTPFDGGSRTSSRHGRSLSPKEHRHRGRHESHTSPRASRSAARVEDARSTGDAASRSGDPDSLVKMNAAAEALEAKEKQKPSFELSGKLAEETNRVAGVNLLYSEPPEARKSDIRWRLYVFKGGEALNEPLYVHRMSSYLFGRERKVADIPTDHPSCSKQHAVLQYRLVEKEQPDGMISKQASHSHFFIPEIFKDLKKVIVLEDDVVVQRDLSFLWNLDMGDKVNGAVKFCGLRLGQLRNLLGKVTYDPQSCAWMSGVNVINLDKWREYNVTENYLQLFEKFRKNDDEASLRAAALPVSLLSFQHLTYPFDERLTLSGLGYDYAIGEEVARTSASLHYNGNMKPWLELSIPDYRKYWKRFLTRDEQFMDECNVLGIWRTAQKKVAHMINQVLSVRRKFEQFEISLVPRSQVSYVQKLARDSIDAQIAKSLSVNAIKERRETCTICLEDTDISKIH